MADPSGNFPLNDISSYQITLNRETKIIKDSEVLVLGGLASLKVTNGEIEFADTSDDLIPAGWIETRSNRDNSVLTGDGSRKITTVGGVILDGVNVVGAGSSVEYGALVWATDGQTLTLTQQDAFPVGFFKEYKGTGTSSIVRLFCPDEAVLFGNLGKSTNREIILVAVVGGAELTVSAASELVTNRPLHKRGSIVNAFAIMTSSDGDSTQGSRSVTFDINATPVAGLSLTLAHGDTVGAINSDTPTGDGTEDFNMGDTLTVHKASGGTVFDADGTIHMIYLTIDNKPGN